MSAIISGLIGGVIAVVVTTAARRAVRSPPADPDGWTRLRPGWLLHGLYAGPAAFAMLIIYATIMNGWPQEDEADQAIFLLIVFMAVIAAAGYYSWLTYGRIVRRRDGMIQIVRPLRRSRNYTLQDVRTVRHNAVMSDYVLRFTNGETVRLSEYLHGVDDLLAAIPMPASR